MNIHKMKVAGLLFAFFILLLPADSKAYFTTAQSATKLTEDTIMYTISYDFGFADRELYMPIMAKRTNDSEPKQYLAEYSILNGDDEVVTAGVSNALVLTKSKDVEVKNGQYYLEPGENATFTLVAFLTIPKEQQVSEKLSLLMTQLPFTMIKNDDSVVNAHLNPSELQYYRTPEVSLVKLPVTVKNPTYTFVSK